MPQVRHISNVYVMRELPHPIRKSSFNETTVKVLVAEAYKDKRRALAYLGAAERILDKLADPTFVSEYKKKINNCRMQMFARSEMQAEPFMPPRVPASKKQEASKPEDVILEELGQPPVPTIELVPVPA